MVAGFAMLATETIVPGFFLLFFGMGAVFMGFFQLVFPGVPLWIELLIFLAVSTLWLGLFRRRLIAYMHKQTPPKKVDEIAGEMAVALETIAPGQIGKAELRGATWNALNLGDRAIEASVRCRVDRVQGLTLEVRPM
jgi:inner membrane protein